MPLTHCVPLKFDGGRGGANSSRLIFSFTRWHCCYCFRRMHRVRTYSMFNRSIAVLVEHFVDYIFVSSSVNWLIIYQHVASNN